MDFQKFVVTRKFGNLNIIFIRKKNNKFSFLFQISSVLCDFLHSGGGVFHQNKIRDSNEEIGKSTAWYIVHNCTYQKYRTRYLLIRNVYNCVPCI